MDEVLVGQTADIVCAYVAHNSVPPPALPDLITSVHRALTGLSTPAIEIAQADAPRLPNGVTIKNSVRPDYLISLETGERFQLLKRHLSTRGMTAEQYRRKWGLPADYPMTAANYSAKRSELAKVMGLGSVRSATPAPAAPPPAPAPAASAPAKTATKRKVPVAA